MSTDRIELHVDEIKEVLANIKIASDVVIPFQMNDRVTDYLIDDKYILRISKNELSEKVKLQAVQSLEFVPKIHSSGTFDVSGNNFYYLVIDYLRGDDLLSVLPILTPAQTHKIGDNIAIFLKELHMITGTSYDIGHYIPTIPNYEYSWQQGHLEYVESLNIGLSGLNPKVESKRIIQSAFEYIRTNIKCLEYQTGPRLLHNDLHPKNIIINNGELSGIIDWECSQFGEADFDIAHLIQWCIYPPKPEMRFDSLLKSLFESNAFTQNVPNIGKRLTIYQLEHELNQLIWNGMNQEEERMNRISGWLNNQVDHLLRKWNID